jgi:hypothetical protein
LDIEGKIKWNDICPSELSYPILFVQSSNGVGYEELGSSKAVLDDGRLSGSVMKDGRFVMYACVGFVFHAAYH